jgi:hypothetical protein
MLPANGTAVAAAAMPPTTPVAPIKNPRLPLSTSWSDMEIPVDDLEENRHFSESRAKT